jgi:hypothetical protein
MEWLAIFALCPPFCTLAILHFRRAKQLTKLQARIELLEQQTQKYGDVFAAAVGLHAARLAVPHRIEDEIAAENELRDVVTDVLCKRQKS